MQGFLNHVEMYGTAAIVLAVLAVLFLFFLLRRYTVTGPRPTRETARR